MLAVSVVLPVPPFLLQILIVCMLLFPFRNLFGCRRKRLRLQRRLRLPLYFCSESWRAIGLFWGNGEEERLAPAFPQNSMHFTAQDRERPGGRFNASAGSAILLLYAYFNRVPASHRYNILRLFKMSVEIARALTPEAPSTASRLVAK